MVLESGPSNTARGPWRLDKGPISTPGQVVVHHSAPLPVKGCRLPMATRRLCTCNTNAVHNPTAGVHMALQSPSSVFSACAFGPFRPPQSSHRLSINACSQGLYQLVSPYLYSLSYRIVPRHGTRFPQPRPAQALRTLALHTPRLLFFSLPHNRVRSSTFFDYYDVKIGFPRCIRSRTVPIFPD